MTDIHDHIPTRRLLTAHEAAQYLGIGTTKLNELRRTKKIRVVRFMSDARYDIADLDRFIDQQRGWGLFNSWRAS
jgi:excisionase family DNA binding protein